MKRSIILLLALTVLGLAVGSSARAAAKQVNDAYNLLSAAKSLYYKIDLPIKAIMVDAKTKKIMKENYSFKSTGVMITDKKTGQSSEGLNLQFGISGDSLKETLGVKSLAIDLDIKTFGAVSYIRLNGYPKDLDAIVDLAGIKGVWIKLENSQAYQAAGLFTELQDNDNSQALVIREKIRLLVNKSNFASVVKELPQGTVENTAVRRYSLKADNKEISKLLLGISQAIDQEVAATAARDFDQLMGRLKISNGELSVGKKKELVRLKFVAMATSTTGTTKETYEFRPDLLFKDINSAKLKVTAPAKFITIEEAGKLLGFSAGNQ